MQPNTTSNSDLRDKLIEYLKDMYAVENHLVDVLQQHADDAADFPVVQAKIQQHLEETKQHRQRLEDCLNAYGEKPNGGKNALTGLIGKIQGALSGARQDTLARNSRDDYVAENFEIASYSMLIATAQAMGDQNTVQACQQNLRDEVNMAKWLEAHTGEVALTCLVQDNINIPTSTITQIQQQENQQMRQMWQSAEQMVQQDTTPVFANSAIAGANPNTPVNNTSQATGRTMNQTSGTLNNPGTDSLSNQSGSNVDPTTGMPVGGTAATSGDTDTYLGSSSDRGPYGTTAQPQTPLSSGGTNRPSTANPSSLNPDLDDTDDDQIQP